MMASNQKNGNIQAGIGDPYWYEWSIGLLKAVEMLNPDSGIESVAFQKAGIKGWDDVVVKFYSGHYDYYQVKHSVPRTNLTFSDLVGKSDDRLSLLGLLAKSWHDMKLSDKDASCILITNRHAGVQNGISANGIYYPPLAEFISHISKELVDASSIKDICVSNEWSEAWRIWQSEIGMMPDNIKLGFLKSLTISTEAPQLEDIEALLSSMLSKIFYIPSERTTSLVKNLLSKLINWTTTVRRQEWITVEDVMNALSDSTPEIFGCCDVPAPFPFFTSRIKVVQEITDLLINKDKHRIVFLEAEPGAGKTSVISHIVNQRVEDYSSLIVDIRYYAYKPITPDSPAIPADADRSASPDSLWFSLLNQLRELLKGRLWKERVPVKNNFITPDEARAHVLRLSAKLAQEKGTPFVIVIDGLDHAARAHRKGLPSLLDSLPTPEMIPQGVRILVAGQPLSGYPEYPIWLKTPHEMVKKLGLNPIEIKDIEQLLAHSNTKLSTDERSIAARIIQDVTGGNTLASVFSVAEAEICNTFDELKERLSTRKIHTGIHAYYNAIWQLTVQSLPNGMSTYISSTLCILQERVTGKMMHTAFPAWGKPIPEWEAILKSLEPLVIRDGGGFRVRHNDIRVFCEQELKTNPSVLAEVASLLADYYLDPSSSIFFRHESVFNLLEIANRHEDKARIFNPQWVINAAANGKSIDALHYEAKEAFRVLPSVKDWDIALAVACGGQTLMKLTDCLDSFPDLLSHIPTPRAPLPQCFETERFVPPLSTWTEDLFCQVLNDIKFLADNEEINRARGLMTHWFLEVSPMRIIINIKKPTNDNDDLINQGISQSRINSLFETLGALAFKLKVKIIRDNPSTKIENHVTSLFERGWVIECIETCDPKDVFQFIQTFHPRYLNVLEDAVENAVKHDMLKVAHSLLEILIEYQDKLALSFRIRAAYWSLKVTGDTSSKWLDVISELKRLPLATECKFPDMLYVAKILGWLKPGQNTGTTASEIIDIIISEKRYTNNKDALRMSFNAAATIGVIEGMISKGDIQVATTLISPEKIYNVVKCLWENNLLLKLEFNEASRLLSFELIEICKHLGGNHFQTIVALCLKEANKYPVEHKIMHTLWHVLKLSDHQEVLRCWAEYWIGKQGHVWLGTDYSDKIEIVTSLSKLCRDEGWYDLAGYAEEKILYCLIGYSGHKEYVFKETLDWVQELLDIAPEAWQIEGVDLLDLCEECTEQGGDNRLRFDIENIITAAAFLHSPMSALNIIYSIGSPYDSYWLSRVRGNTIFALESILTKGITNDKTEILAFWSCLVGMTRWFDKEQAHKITSFRDHIIKTAPSAQKKEIVKLMQEITPGEFCLNEHRNNSWEEESDDENVKDLESKKQTIVSDDVNKAVSDLELLVKQNYKPNLIEISNLATQVVRINPKNRTELINDIFALIGINQDYVSSWDFYNCSHPLKKLIPLIRENEIWELMKAAVRPTGESYWLRAVSHNVHLICLYHATSKGIISLRKGTQYMLAMHRLWNGMPDGERKYMHIKATNEVAQTWQEFVALILRHLLSSDSAETVSNAIRGLCSLVKVTPEILYTIFKDCNSKQLSRLLLVLEIWSVENCDIVSSILKQMQKSDINMKLYDRIQIWISQLTQSQVTGNCDIAPFVKYCDDYNHHNHNLIILPTQSLFTIAPTKDGSFHFSNVFSAAQERLHRIRSITGVATEELESDLAQKLNAECVISPKKSNDGFAIENGDMCIKLEYDHIFDSALDNELSKHKLNHHDLGNIAIAVTHGDDPWIIRSSPISAPPIFDWPSKDEIDGWLNGKIDKNNVLNRLRLLAQGNDLNSDYCVLGAYLRLFPSNNDIEMYYWLEAGLASQYSGNKKIPICPSSRCFQFFLADRYEPLLHDRSPLVFFSRSLRYLSFSTLNIVPAKKIQNNLNWKPSQENPLIWKCNDLDVARYESYHSTINYDNEQRYQRTPILSRWVVRKESLEALPNLSPQWDFETQPIKTL